MSRADFLVIFEACLPKSLPIALAEAISSHSILLPSSKVYFLCPGSKVAEDFVTTPFSATPPPIPVLKVR